MAFNLAQAYVELSARGVSTLMGQIKGVGAQLGTMTTLAGTAAAGVAAIGTVSLARWSTGLASDAEEAASKFGFVFGQAAGEVEAALDQFAAAAGRSKFELRSLAGDVGAILGPMGLSADATAKMSTNMTILASDLASFFNASDTEALKALQSALIGEAEPMRKFGVTINESKIQAEAFKLGIAKTAEQITSSVKAQAIYSIVMRETATAQGDAIRTSGSYANVMRGLEGAIRDTGVMVGQLFLPTFTEIGKFLTQNVLSLQANEATWKGWGEQLGAITRDVLGSIGTLDFSGLVTSAMGFAQSIASIIPAITGMISTVKTWVSDNWQLVTALTSVGVIVGTVIGATTLLSAGVAVLGTAFAALTSPLGLVALALAGLAIAFPEFFNGVLGGLWDLVANFDIAWQLVYQHVALALSNTWERIKTWAMNLVEIVSWAGSNWYQIIESYANMQLTIWKNLATNFMNGWQALLDFFQGNPITFNWTPLMEGFKSTISAMPELTKANIADTNAEIEKLNAELEGRMLRQNTAAANKADGTAQANQAKAGMGAVKFEPGAGSAMEKKRDNKFEFTALAAFAEKMQQEASRDSGDKKRDQLAERQANAAEKLVQQADGGGLKVVVANKAPVGNGGVAGAFG